MADWQLSFRHPGSGSLEIATCEQLVTDSVGNVTTEVGELSGNPRDFYSRSITIRGQRGDLKIELRADQGMRGANEPEPIISRVYLLVSAPYATKLAAWQALTTAFAKIGWIDDTLTSAAPIIDDATAAGDTSTVARIRAESAAALIEQARGCRYVSLQSPRTAVEPILAAYQLPEDISGMSLSDCGLRALPANFDRFPNLENLALDEDAFAGSILRGVSLPKLLDLALNGKGIWRVIKEDLAGFPNLEILACHGNLEDLDPEIIEVCPKLIRVDVNDTPLSRDDRKMTVLRARWPRMLWNYHDRLAQPAPATVEPPRASPAPDPAPAPQTVDPELQPYFDTILATADDDAPRLALAELLTARGDERGEQIRLACELAKLERDDPSRAALAVRCQVMQQFAYFSNTKYPFLTKEWPGRGFIETIGCTAVNFLAHAETVMRDAPIRVCELREIGGNGARLAACPALARLRRLELPSPPAADRATLLGSPHLARLRELTLRDRFDTAESLDTLAADLRGLSALRVLVLMGTLSRDAVPGLIELVQSRDLEQLDVEFATLRPKSILETLWDALGDERMRPRRLPRVPFENAVLSFGSQTYSLAQIRALVETGLYRGAVALETGPTSIGDEVVTFLATSSAFPSLVELDLSGSNVTNRGVLVLASKAVGFDHLESIHLDGDDRDVLGISDTVVEVLARSTRLPALRKISRTVTHHVYAADARDDTEVISIQRDDGRVVESHIGHLLWP